ncbi:MAG TPA: hypothetical protein VKQ28_08670 [Candidatus Acidoferrum sp.]|nr:hypothetical protein [Candidatus Acidoferrum sp.]
MKPRILRNAITLVSLAVLTFTLTALPSRAQQQDPAQESTGDPVADAARRAREQKKKESTKPKKVYTDDDVSHSTSSGASDSPATSQDAAKNPSTQAKDSTKTAEDKESPETKWRKQFRDAYASLDRAEKELDVLQREDNKAQVQYYSDPQKALAEQYSRQDINEKDAKIAAKKKEIDQIKQRISDMEEALRKSGGDPGWAAR